MYELAQEYRVMGWKNISFVILNKRGESAKFKWKLRVKAKQIPVYQEPENKNIFRRMGAIKDDVFVYDRCGRLQYFFRFPTSYFGYPLVRTAIQNLYFYPNLNCGACGEEGNRRPNWTKWRKGKKTGGKTTASPTTATQSTIVTPSQPAGDAIRIPPGASLL